MRFRTGFPGEIHILVWFCFPHHHLNDILRFQILNSIACIIHVHDSYKMQSDARHIYPEQQTRTCFYYNDDHSMLNSSAVWSMQATNVCVAEWLFKSNWTRRK